MTDSKMSEPKRTGLRAEQRQSAQQHANQRTGEKAKWQQTSASPQDSAQRF